MAVCPGEEVTALSEALAQAQRSAIAAIGRTYVHEPFDADIAKDAFDKMGLRDKIEQDELINAWALTNAYGGQLPTNEGPFRMPHSANGPEPAATEAQNVLIKKLAQEKGIEIPSGFLTKQQAHEWIDAAKAR